MSHREIKLVWNNTSIAAPAKNQKPKPEEQTSASDALFKLVGAGGSIVIVLGFAFWLGVLSNSITAQNTLFTEKLTTFTKQLDRIEKDLDGVKDAQYFPKAKEIGIPNPKISFAPARATETFNVSYPGVEQQHRPPLDVTFRIEEIGDKFVKLKPQVFLRRGDTVWPLPDRYPLITVPNNKSVGINFLVEVDDLPAAISGFAGKYVAEVMIGLLDKLPRNLVFASQRLGSRANDLELGIPYPPGPDYPELSRPGGKPSRYQPLLSKHPSNNRNEADRGRRYSEQLGRAFPFKRLVNGHFKTVCAHIV